MLSANVVAAVGFARVDCKKLAKQLAMTALQDLLATFRNTAKTEREKGNYFERLVKVYLQNEPLYRDMFSGNVYLWEEWRKHWMSLGNPDPQSDAGIDLVAVEDVADNPRIFAIQAKFS